MSGFTCQILSRSIPLDEKCVTCEYWEVAFAKLAKVKIFDLENLFADALSSLVFNCVSWPCFLCILAIALAVTAAPPLELVERWIIFTFLFYFVIVLYGLRVEPAETYWSGLFTHFPGLGIELLEILILGS
jgi:hypothetical protein